MAQTTCLAAARHAVLADAGWDVERDGLSGAPAIRVLGGARRHVTIDRALRLLGFGTAAIVEVPSDDQGRMDVAALRDALAGGDGPTIVCAQLARSTRALSTRSRRSPMPSQGPGWLHVDGAFGLWAAASPELAHPDRATTARTPGRPMRTMAERALRLRDRVRGAPRGASRRDGRAGRLPRAGPGCAREEVDWTPEFSRRARGFAVYAALRSLGRAGVADLIERSCARARQFAAEIETVPGCEVLNDVVLNQVLFRFPDDETTATSSPASRRAAKRG